MPLPELLVKDIDKYVSSSWEVPESKSMNTTIRLPARRQELMETIEDIEKELGVKIFRPYDPALKQGIGREETLRNVLMRQLLPESEWVIPSKYYPVIKEEIVLPTTGEIAKQIAAMDKSRIDQGKLPLYGEDTGAYTDNYHLRAKPGTRWL